MLKFLKKTSGKLAVATTGLFVSTMALAETPAVDYTALTSKIDFSGAITAVLGVIALVVGALVAWKGGQWIVKAVRAA
uniref:Phage coat protein n=1 Tax=Dulem virus 52 TaxID=3145763 RepID=A0AAU8B3Y8_9VIRU